ncbi:MAG: threonine synthase, partial [Oscillospiraceae bacterium]|nr:threonine synthase [Oscillospiraceae bacterium]
EGFRDVARTKIMVFYPRDGVSDVQKLQMMTQGGGNVGVLSVKGNFDDAQNGVKEIFSDGRLREALETRGWFLSSANSINWGRLLPQIVYYVSAYCDLYRRGAISAGQEINFCVPTGNFGNILAGYYAKKLGLPIKTLICASNRNDVLTDFINTGVYDRNRAFFTTLSPSMDILVSSNLERLLFDLSGADDALTASYMRALGDGGRYEANAEIRAAVARDFACGCLDDERTKKTIAEVFKTGYLIDTHTAVAYGVLNDYRARTGDAAPAVVVSTASPFKFCDSVLDALGQPSAAPGLELIDALAAFSGAEAPKQLRALRGKRVRFDGAAEKSGMRAAVEDFLK